MNEVNINNLSSQLTSPLKAKYCDTFLCRLRGLTFRSQIPSNWGLLLVQPKETKIDSGIHMVGVFFDLGVVWINKSGIVVDIKIAKKWVSLLLPNSPASFILEIVPERIEEFSIGDKVTFE